MADSARMLFSCCFVASAVLVTSMASSSVNVSSRWMSFDCTCSEFLPSVKHNMFISIFILALSRQEAHICHECVDTFPIVLFVSSDSEVAFWGYVFLKSFPVHR